MVGPVNQPYVGKSAFAHKGGIHVSAMQRNEATYEHVRPKPSATNAAILVRRTRRPLERRSQVGQPLSAAVGERELWPRC